MLDDALSTYALFEKYFEIVENTSTRICRSISFDMCWYVALYWQGKHRISFHVVVICNCSSMRRDNSRIDESEVVRNDKVRM